VVARALTVTGGHRAHEDQQHRDGAHEPGTAPPFRRAAARSRPLGEPAQEGQAPRRAQHDQGGHDGGERHELKGLGEHVAPGVTSRGRDQAEQYQ